ncbi:MAG TPA: efflux RND transporter periplasmic adaptor subunit, partial [Lentimicrobium sp.]|nr:efflux RND transporter periplasmic adaptor subunit [Lentimicrobium sp.]
QFESAQMQLGKPEPVIFQHTIKANGIVTASPSGMAQISSLISGKIKRIAVNTGDKVVKGQLLCTIESTELIQLQQDFAEASGKLKAVLAEYERQKSLAGENIASQKTFLNAEGEYKSLSARCEGLRTKLQLLGLNTEKLSQGFITSELSLFAPISGFVASLEAETGSFAEPQRILMEITDLNQLQLKLAVFEKDISHLNPGQEIKYFNPGTPEQVYKGTLTSYSRTIDPETKALTVIGSIQAADKAQLVSGMYLEAEIITGERMVMALPDEAILKSGDTKLVLVQKSGNENEMTFIRKEIKTGVSSNGFTELINAEGLDQVLIKGGFNLVIE